MSINSLFSLPSPLAWFERSVALLAEGRAAFELAGLAAGWAWLAGLPAGDGHPVLVIPGPISGEAAIWPLEQLLTERGHVVYVWDQGIDLAAGAGIIDPLDRRLDQLTDLHGTGISLIGLSLGGLLAREVAKHRPERVRQVITLGTPSQALDHRTVAPMAPTGLPDTLLTVIESLRERLAKAPPVPLTSIYSRIGGIVNWRTCQESPGPWRENVEVFSSHLGLGHNPLVLAVIAERLAQPANGWRPYRGCPDVPFGLIAPVIAGASQTSG